MGNPESAKKVGRPETKNQRSKSYLERLRPRKNKASEEDEKPKKGLKKQKK